MALPSSKPQRLRQVVRRPPMAASPKPCGRHGRAECPPLIGREEELELLRRRWRHAEEGAERLDEDELADWRAGRDAVYQLAALTVGARLAVADG
jgi:hypothetical protein